MQKIWIYREGDDDPHACTALRLFKVGLAKQVESLSFFPRQALLLDPFAQKALSPSDRARAARYGIGLVDCSWEHAQMIFRSLRNRERRALPFLLAANPVKQYQPITLSTAEAAASALYILGWKEEAVDLLSKFKWAELFWALNQNLLEAYSRCSDSSEVVRLQIEEIERRQRGARNPPSVSDGIKLSGPPSSPRGNS